MFLALVQTCSLNQNIPVQSGTIEPAKTAPTELSLMVAFISTNRPPIMGLHGYIHFIYAGYTMYGIKESPLEKGARAALYPQIDTKYYPLLRRNPSHMSCN